MPQFHSSDCSASSTCSSAHAHTRFLFQQSCMHTLAFYISSVTWLTALISA